MSALGNENVTGALLAAPIAGSCVSTLLSRKVSSEAKSASNLARLDARPTSPPEGQEMEMPAASW
jgi:hypothetical protein